MALPQMGARGIDCMRSLTDPQQQADIIEGVSVEGMFGRARHHLRPERTDRAAAGL